MSEEYDGNNRKGATPEKSLEQKFSEQFPRICRFFVYGAYVNHLTSDDSLPVVQDARRDDIRAQSNNLI